MKINTKMKEEFKKDYYRMTGEEFGFSVKTIKNLIFMHNVRYMFWWRGAKKGKFFAKIQVYRYARKYGLEISSKARIDEGLYLGHPYNITVGADCIIGKNVNLHKGVTLGKTARGDKAGSPCIANNVWIGINATVVGNILVGEDVLIAPGAYVNFDVPAHSVVIGNPAIIHHKENAVEGYVNYAI